MIPTETVHMSQLANGMKVLVIPDHRAPVCTHMVWYQVGSADEEVGKSGIAHFLEHLMFKGTHNNKAGLFGETVTRLGGQENAFTGNDYTAYYQRISPDHLKTMMEFESDRMRHLALNEEDVRTERDVVLEERRQRTDNDPSAKLYEQMSNKLWSHHPYGIPIIGWEDEIQKLNREDAFEVYHQYYAPNNATLIVAGDVQEAQVIEFANATYGKLEPSQNLKPRKRTSEPARTSHETVLMRDEKVMQPQLQRAYRVPSANTSQKGQSEAIDLLSYILGGGSSSRLYKSLVMEQGLAANAGCYYQSTAYDEARFVIYATPLENITLEQLEDAIDTTIKALTTICEDEIKRAKTRLVAESIYAQDKQATLAQIYGSCLMTGLSIEDVQQWAHRVKAITKQEITAQITLLAKNKSVSSHLLPLES